MIGRLCPGLKYPCATLLHSVAVIGCHHTALPACGLDSSQRFSVIHRLHGLDYVIDNVSMLDHQVINQPAQHRQRNKRLSWDFGTETFGGSTGRAHHASHRHLCPR